MIYNFEWAGNTPDNCPECENTRQCSTKYFVVGQEYPEPPNHCECGHVTMGGFHGTTELEEQVKTGRVQHTKIW